MQCIPMTRAFNSNLMRHCYAETRSWKALTLVDHEQFSALASSRLPGQRSELTISCVWQNSHHSSFKGDNLQHDSVPRNSIWRKPPCVAPRAEDSHNYLKLFSNWLSHNSKSTSTYINVSPKWTGVHTYTQTQTHTQICAGMSVCVQVPVVLLNARQNMAQADDHSHSGRLLELVQWSE